MNHVVNFASHLEDAALKQAEATATMPFIYPHVALMPDAHFGLGSSVGTVFGTKGAIIPAAVGVDIGCGMIGVCTNYTASDLEGRDLVTLRDYIERVIPLSPGNYNSTTLKETAKVKVAELEELAERDGVDLSHSPTWKRQLGSLGGGNHFIEMDINENGQLYLVIHTGSRNLGKQVAEYYQDLAWKGLKNGNKGELIKAKIEELKVAGRQSEIEAEITKIQSTVESVPKELAYCDGELFDKYIHDMKITQEYAYWNREAILDTIVDEMHLHVVEQWQTIHNYIDTENMILRKGSVSAQAGEKLIIPINMRDGSLICIGKGNTDWNYSAPHGAGRLMSRSEAKQSITLSEFKKTMKEAGIYSTSVNQSTIDESPMAYKPMQEIIDNIKDTVEIIDIIKPIYNFKAGEE